MSDTANRIRTILAQHARLAKDAATLTEDADLYQAGMSSHASVNVMLALEAEFGEIPEELLTRSVFRSIASITCAMHSLAA